MFSAVIHVQVLLIAVAMPLRCVVGHRLDVGPCILQILDTCSNDTIDFYFFSTSNPGDIQQPIMLNGIAPILPDWVDFKMARNKLVVHGYGGSMDFKSTKTIRNAYLTNANHPTNVIVVDWGKLARTPCYPTAALNTKQAGECIATFLIGLQALDRGFENRNLHAIGFSLGAHAVSFASNALQQALGVRFNRITGLEPALPFFGTAQPKWKLDSSDADFVDVIHTNAGVFGKIEASGHIDFYVNGGKLQPACEGHRNQPLCSHLMVATYFAESISTQIGFFGVDCPNYIHYVFGMCKDGKKRSAQRHHGPVLMGEYCPRDGKGVYFVKTSARAPYAQGFIDT